MRLRSPDPPPNGLGFWRCAAQRSRATKNEAAIPTLPHRGRALDSGLVATTVTGPPPPSRVRDRGIRWLREQETPIGDSVLSPKPCTKTRGLELARLWPRNQGEGSEALLSHATELGENPQSVEYCRPGDKHTVDSPLLQIAPGRLPPDFLAGLVFLA